MAGKKKLKIDRIKFLSEKHRIVLGDKALGELLDVDQRTILRYKRAGLIPYKVKSYFQR
jgi:hypothetical protein